MSWTVAVSVLVTAALPEAPPPTVTVTGSRVPVTPSVAVAVTVTSTVAVLVTCGTVVFPDAVTVTCTVFVTGRIVSPADTPTVIVTGSGVTVSVAV